METHLRLHLNNVNRLTLKRVPWQLTISNERPPAQGWPGLINFTSGHAVAETKGPTFDEKNRYKLKTTFFSLRKRQSNGCSASEVVQHPTGCQGKGARTIANATGALGPDE